LRGRESNDMNLHSMRSALKEYEQVGARSQVEGAPPERLVQLMLEGALDRISLARGAMENGQVAAKGERIGKAISLVEGLRASLDHERGGELAGNLDALYEYAARRLLEANLRNDAAILDEVSRLLREIKQAWDRIVGGPEIAP
jgi:flagellar secretion chaperone FliS